MHLSVLECRVLGPTEVAVEGIGVDLGGPLPRRLVTALVAVGGQPVPDERLVDAVWGLAGPRRGSAALHVYVSRLRRALGAQAREALERTGSGYRLRLIPGSADAERFSLGLDAAGPGPGRRGGAGADRRTGAVARRGLRGPARVGLHRGCPLAAGRAA